VLALQGGFSEHVESLRKCGADAVEVRTAAELSGVDGLVIPGGESTSLGLIAERQGLVAPLRAFVAERPTWGTCAGLIMLADQVTSQAEQGQTLIGGLAVSVERNAFGRQVQSYSTPLVLHGDGDSSLKCDPHSPMVFIRAPVITRVLSPECRVLATLPQKGAAGEDQIVAVRQGHLLGTAFHPELTDDLSWHQYFASLVAEKAQCKAEA